MVNAWSLAASILDGTFEEDYPLMNDDDDLEWIEKSGGFEWTPGSPWPPEEPADIDDMYMHHFTNAYSPYNDGWTQEHHQKELEKLEVKAMDYEPQKNHQYKYHEEEILKDIEEYVSKTYQGHYTGAKHEFRKVQTIDLMAARDIATDFCQANILKYGSRYGSKNGKNKTDLLKVIHYAMLLLHFDGHYGEPSMPSGNFDQMP